MTLGKRFDRIIITSDKSRKNPLESVVSVEMFWTTRD